MIFMIEVNYRLGCVRFWDKLGQIGTNELSHCLNTDIVNLTSKYWLKLISQSLCKDFRAFGTKY